VTSPRALARAIRGVVTLFAAMTLGCVGAEPRRPNVVVILADDLGWADLGVHGSPDVATPHIDSIAAAGVRFAAGYVSAPQCSPSRAGLLTGRYQNRFGFEYNFQGQWDKGLDPAERTIADHLRAAGYATGMVGKWHLGKVDALRPDQRGFEETLWHPNGGIYLPAPETGSLPGMFRGAEPASVPGYSTNAFTDEAIAFVERHRDEPFFLYLAYATPHTPLHAKDEDLARFAHVADPDRRALVAMMASLDENVGRLLGALRAERLEEDTLVVFLSDNGGDEIGAPGTGAGRNASRNRPFRGGKRDLLEGGIRVPFLMQWKGTLPAGLVYEPPILSLDVLPTALAAGGVPLPDGIDGVDLLPFLRGERRGDPHDALFWRFDFLPLGDPPRRWAIREGHWKLVKNAAEPLALYDLANDAGEEHDLSAQHADRVAAMRTRWKQWNAPMRAPAWPASGASLVPER
jgi:arylsulfatase A-like enzyme